MGRPWKIVYVEECATQGDALQQEIAIKRLKRAAKLLLAGLAS